MPSNPPNKEALKRLRRLHRAAERREQGRFLVEGRRCIGAFLQAGWEVCDLFVREDLSPPPEWSATVRPLSAANFARLSQQQQASGFLAEFALPPAGAWDPAAGGLILDGVADPGNLGSLIRSAVAFGLRQICCLPDCADAYSAKVVQASAGALARCQLHRCDELPELQRPLLGLSAHGGKAAGLPPAPLFIALGSEAHGLSPAVIRRCDQLLTLPLAADSVESLGVAAAGAIGLYLCSLCSQCSAGGTPAA